MFYGSNRMPTYSFYCRKCRKPYDALVRIGQIAPCPTCGDKRPEKLVAMLARLLGGKSAKNQSGNCRPRRSGFG
jgi:putative FmdB family regulatory protein